MKTEKQSVYGRSRKTWNNEQEALQDVCCKQNITESDVYADHTATKWQWKTNLAPTNNRKYSTAEYSQTEATQKAMADFGDTFEGNLETAHTAEYYVYSKIRG